MDNNTLNLEEKILDLEKRIGILETTISKFGPSDQPITAKHISAKEFLLSKNISSTASAVEKTLMLAYFLENHEKVGSFNIDDLVNIFQSAKEALPLNVNDVINKNISKGLIMEVKERKNSKKAWVLTSSGEKYVNERKNNI